MLVQLILMKGHVPLIKTEGITRVEEKERRIKQWKEIYPECNVIEITLARQAA